MTVVASADGLAIIEGDCLTIMAGLADSSVDAIVTDPPYGLGFMGKQWDDLPPGREWAEACLRVLKPGGHLLAFGGSRTWHRLAVAVEDAGFEIRDSIAWLYGSGFPKSLDVSKAIDKRPGVGRHAEFAAHLAERRTTAGLTRADVSERVVGTRTGACWNWEHHQFPEAKWWPALRDLLDMDEDKWGPVIAEAERIRTGTHSAGLATRDSGVGGFGEGGARRDAPATDEAKRWQGWGTALKPAFEPVVVARKPLSGTVAANVLTYGTGALNIDATRVGAGEGVVTFDRSPREGHQVYAGSLGTVSGVKPSGQGRWPANVALDDTQADMLDAQSGTLTSGVLAAHHARAPKDAGIRRAYGSAEGERGYGDTGGASRFFPTFKYQAKAPTKERPKVDGVAHPTVKPLELMRWLVRLVTPPGGLVLDPFAGSGTTAQACQLEGFRCLAIEREPTYMPLILARLGLVA